VPTRAAKRHVARSKIRFPVSFMMRTRLLRKWCDGSLLTEFRSEDKLSRHQRENLGEPWRRTVAAHGGRSAAAKLISVRSGQRRYTSWLSEMSHYPDCASTHQYVSRGSQASTGARMAKRTAGLKFVESFWETGPRLPGLQVFESPMELSSNRGKDALLPIVCLQKQDYFFRSDGCPILVIAVTRLRACGSRLQPSQEQPPR
jgi:hypothetical protein